MTQVRQKALNQGIRGDKLRKAEDPCAAARQILRESLTMARALSASLSANEQLGLARAITASIITSYWEALQESELEVWNLQAIPDSIVLKRLSGSAASLAHSAGAAAASLPPLEANYLIGIIYTGMMPPSLRAEFGAFYTPPALCERLIHIATESGVDWMTAKVLDPACGGGAFLAPVARRMADDLVGCTAKIAVKNIGQRLRGFEIDSFAAWMSQAFLEATLLPLCREAGMRLPPVVEVCDSLDRTPGKETFDLVIGNPPYGRVKLSPERREKFKRGLFGHANLYGLFTDLALRFTKPRGIIAFVTPTSFLAGEYFKSLRKLLGHEAPPAAIDFVSERKGVFEDVLQETLLAAYRRGDAPAVGQVHFLAADPSIGFTATAAGPFSLPADVGEPWLMPRSPEQRQLASNASSMPHRLSDYGYKVSTGPLVWNRHKNSLRDGPGKNRFPLIWAESVRTDGSFEFRADRRNHKPWFAPAAGEDWVVTNSPCVLLQRTTAKEQARRLIAAELPVSFLKKHGAVVVENHLNMIRPISLPAVHPSVIAALLNSHVVDQLFRCVNGSVAVSAFELEAMPLPPVPALRQLERLIANKAKKSEIEAEIATLYDIGAKK